MKTFKNIALSAVMVMAGATITGCTDYQDEIDSLDTRVTYLESLVSQTNKDITNLQKVVDAWVNGWYIENMAYLPEEDGGGYVINFRKDQFDIALGDSVRGKTQRMSAIVKDGEKG